MNQKHQQEKAKFTDDLVANSVFMLLPLGFLGMIVFGISEVTGVADFKYYIAGSLLAITYGIGSTLAVVGVIPKTPTYIVLSVLTGLVVLAFCDVPYASPFAKVMMKILLRD